jgi:SAM-dependent methyltransferase
MDDLSKEYVISFFDKNLMLHGDRPEAVRWTPRGQREHYRALLDIGDISGSKILDFGCGKGDLYAFLRERNIPVDYTGCDINGKLIELAKSKFPGVDFRVFDIDGDELREDFDYVILCGVFNLKVDGVDDLARRALVKLFRHCRVGLAFNALSAHNPKKDFELNYTSPEELFAFVVRNLSPFVSLRHDRIAYDFSMFIYRDRNAFHDGINPVGA